MAMFWFYDDTIDIVKQLIFRIWLQVEFSKGPERHQDKYVNDLIHTISANFGAR